MHALRARDEALSTVESFHGANAPTARLQAGVPQSGPNVKDTIRRLDARNEAGAPPFEHVTTQISSHAARLVFITNPSRTLSERMRLHGPEHHEPAATSYAVRSDMEDGSPLWADGITTAARNMQDARADVLADRLERAVTALVQCRLSETQGRLEDLRRVVLDLYDEEIITREQACERGQISASEFFDLLDDHRHRAQSA